MPTGYTAAIQEGATFKEFALQCARAFGAAIMQRDDPNDAPLQTVVEPSDYHIKELDKSKQQKITIDAYNDKQWLDLLDAEHKDKLKSIAKRKKQADETKAKYNAVLASAKNWTPPSDDHVGIKDFMIQQIEDSIKWDCDVHDEDYKKPTLEAFKTAKYDSVNWSIDYHEKNYKEEVQRCADRTKWLTDYVKSL